MKVPDVCKIAVVRANAIGDFVFTLPALEALRAAYPGAEIVLLGLPWHAGFLEGRPGPIDRVIVVPVSRGVRGGPETGDDPAELDAFFEWVQRERFDLALQMHGGGRYSNVFTRRLGARMTIGMRTPDAELLDRWMPYVYFQPEVLRYLELVALVGARVVTVEPRLALTECDLHAAYAAVPRLRGPLAVLHPGAGDPARRWPPHKFAAVGDALAAAGAHVVVTGTPRERPLAEAVAGAMRAGVQNACGRLSLGGLAGLLSRCSVVVSNDSGPLHLAAAVGAPTVGIYWCGNLFTASPPERARHRPAISWRLECPICGAHFIHARCEHRVSAVADVTVAEVRDAALELLGANLA